MKVSKNFPMRGGLPSGDIVIYDERRETWTREKPKRKFSVRRSHAEKGELGVHLWVRLRAQGMSFREIEAYCSQAARDHAPDRSVRRRDAGRGFNESPGPRPSPRGSGRGPS